MGIRAQKWAERYPLTAGLAVLVSAAIVILGGIFWMNSAEGKAVCAHSGYYEMFDQATGPYLAENRITVNYTQCSGYPGHVTNANYWCSWSNGYSGSCSGWISGTHAEVDGHNCYAGVCWNEVVAVDLSNSNGKTFTCSRNGTYDPTPYYHALIRCFWHQSS